MLRERFGISAIIIILIIMMVLGIGVFVVVKNIKSDEKEINNNNNNSSLKVEEFKLIDENGNVISSNKNDDVSSIGTVAEGTNITYDESGAFLMSIEEIVDSKNGIISGTILRGSVKTEDTIQLVGFSDEIKTMSVDSIKMSTKTIDEAKIGEKVIIALRGATVEELEVGQVLAKTDSIVAAKKIDADIYMYSPEEGGRKAPVFDYYRPQIKIREGELTGTIRLPEKVEKVNPGDEVSVTIILQSHVAVEEGMEFLIKEGGRESGRGTITKVY